MSDRFKFRTWDNAYKKYRNGLAFHDNQVCTYDDNTCVLEQCTGLKDKNGKLIYEGDIVELTRSRNYGWCKRGRRLKVQWNTFNCCGFGFGAIGNLTRKCAENCIVIGNIHENPELLNADKA